MSQDTAISSEDHEEHGLGHVVGYGPLLATGVGLIILTALTVAVRYVDAGELNMPIALGIAGFKATLVGLYFMHLRWDRPFNGLVLVGSIVFVVLLMMPRTVFFHLFGAPLRHACTAVA